MTKRKVIATKQLPARPAAALWSGATTWLLLDRFNAPQWLYGALGLFFVLAFVTLLAVVISSDTVELKELQ